MITITKDMAKFEGLKFVMKATNKNQMRPVYAKVNFKEWGAEATDGHRLHRAEFVHNYELGTYEVIKNTKALIILNPNDDNIYPDTSKIWPADKERFALPEIKDQPKNFAALATIIRNLPDDAAINSDYLFNILNTDTWTCTYPETKENPMLFKNGTKSALLMLTKI